MGKWSESGRDLQRAERRAKKAPCPDMSAFRPKTRGDCGNEMRPCPWVSCRYHLFLETRDGTIVLPHGGDPEALLRMQSTCSLDVAAEGAHSLEQVGEHFNIG